MSGRSECQTEQYFSRESAIARSTLAAGTSPVTAKCSRTPSSRFGSSGRRSASRCACRARRGSRPFVRMWTTSMAMQPARPKARAWTGEGPAWPSLSRTRETEPAAPRKRRSPSQSRSRTIGAGGLTTGGAGALMGAGYHFDPRQAGFGYDRRGFPAGGQPFPEAVMRAPSLFVLAVFATAPLGAEIPEAVDKAAIPNYRVILPGLAAAGLRYVWVPVSADTFSAADVDAVAKVLDDPAAGPTLLHCSSANRVGAVWTVLQVRKGKTLAEAEAEGRAIGLASPAMQEAVKRVLGQP